jgi:hypothetical protein
MARVVGMLGGEELYTRDLLNDADWGWNEGGADDARQWAQPTQPQHLQLQWQQPQPSQPLQTLQTHQQQLSQPPLQPMQPCFVQATSMDWQPATNCTRAPPPSAENPAKRLRLA